MYIYFIDYVDTKVRHWTKNKQQINLYTKCSSVRHDLRMISRVVHQFKASQNLLRWIQTDRANYPIPFFCLMFLYTY